MKVAILFLGLALFFAGAAFQKSIIGTIWDRPDGGAASLILSCYFLGVGIRLVSRFQQQKISNQRP